jgi:hypothetical protein
MSSWSSDIRAILYLQRRVIVNWFRRSIRSPFFWIIGAFILFVVIGQIAAVIDRPDDPDVLAGLDQTYFNVIAAVALFGAVLIGLWRGTTNTPGASLADVVLLMGSPVSARLQYGLVMARTSIVNALVIGTWMLAVAGGMTFGIEDDWIAIRVLFIAMVVVLLSEFLRYAVWIGTEQVIVRDPASGYRLRLVIKLTVLSIGVITGLALIWPLTGNSVGNWRDALTMIAERGELVTMIPPMSLAARVFDPDGLSLLSGLVLASLTFGTMLIALYWARDFTEPVSIMAERKTDPRGQMLETGSDVQWAALSQFGVSPRVRTAVPPFGRGPWVLLWGGITRWVRYQIAAAWITLLILGSLGVLAALGVQFGLFEVEFAWAMALILPFFGSVNMFMDELRRQFIFLVPGSTWAKLTAGAVTSVLDGLLSCLIIVAGLTVLGAIPLSHAAGLALLGFAIALLGQACLALVQVLLPFWVGQRIRVTVTFIANGIGALPGLVGLIVFYIAVSPLAGLIFASVVTLIVGLIVIAIAAKMFDRIEFSG